MHATAYHDRELDILLLGPVPPPLGGVGSHLMRLVPRLEEAGFRVGVLNHFSSREAPTVVGVLKKNPLKYFYVPRRYTARLVHYHHSRWPHLVAVAVGKRRSRSRYIITIHSADPARFALLSSRVPLLGKLLRWSLRRFDRIIVVNSSMLSVMRENLGSVNVEVIPAFIRPRETETRLSSHYDNFFENRLVIVATAYRIKPLPSGGDLYGLDTAAAAFEKLGPLNPDLRLAIFVARAPRRRAARRYAAQLQGRLEKAGLRDRVLMIFGEPLIPALRHNVIFLRPTRAEGDAVSLREAQHAGVPVIASDVVPRPRGITTFPTGDRDELVVAIETILESGLLHSSASEREGEEADENFAQRLIDLYRSELARQGP